MDRTAAIRIFAAPANEPRARRASDLVLLIPALAAAAAGIVAYPPGASEQALERYLSTLPNWLDPLWALLLNLLWLLAILLVAAVLLGRRYVLAIQALTALVLAALASACAARLAVGTWPELLGAMTGEVDAESFPTVWLAEATALIVTVSPHLARPLRSLGHRLLAAGVLGALMVGGGTPFGTVTAVLLAVAVAAAVRLATGTSLGRPGPDRVAAALAELGVPGARIEESGRFHVRAVDAADRRLLVKVYGRDAYDSQLVARLWRRLWYRRALAPGVGWVQAAEHEGFLTLLARRGGVPTLDVVTAGTTHEGDALLVLEGEARPFEGALAGAWETLDRLRAQGIAHQQIDTETLVLIDGDAGFVDFDGAMLARGPDELTTDRAQLLAATAELAGTEPAVDAALAALGSDGLAELLPFLQSAAFRPTLKRALEDADIDIDDLRAHAAEKAGVEPPEPIQLRRVSVASVVQIGLLVLAAATILTAAGNIDWEQVATALGDASWVWLVAGIVVAQLPRIAQAVAVLGSVPAALPLGPVYALQVAMGYMNIALPSSVARMAVNVRFFQRQGIAAPTAIASGMIDAVATALVQAVVLVLLLVFSEASLAFDMPELPGDSRRMALLVAGAVLAVVLAIGLVGPLRRGLVDQVRRWWPDVRAALATLRASTKLAQLGFGNLAAELGFAIALGLIARGFGYTLPITELLMITVSVWLLAGVIPVPGGIGVAELGLTVGLTAAGMTAEAAFAAVIVYRGATFYLPPLWGFFALRWLQRGRYL